MGLSVSRAGRSANGSSRNTRRSAGICTASGECDDPFRFEPLLGLADLAGDA